MKLSAFSVFFLTATAIATAADWRTEANERIEKIRKGDFTLRVTDAAGRPLANTPVQIELVRHAFHFGTAIAYEPFADQGDDGRRYRAFILEHFNTLVCENVMKWHVIEKTPGTIDYTEADALLAWAHEHNLDMRGHCLFWDREKHIPPWLKTLSPAELKNAVETHLDTTVIHYRGQLLSWDVNNEMLDGGFYTTHLGDDIDAGMFREAHHLDPVPLLFVNEFGILGNDAKTTHYLALIADLQRRGAPVGGIGVQEHSCERFVTSEQTHTTDALPERARHDTLTPAAMLATLDHLATTGLPIHLSEISSKSPDEQHRANGLEMLFRLGFSHPGVEAIMVWGFWEKAHWLGPDAALVDKNWHLTAAGQRLHDLLTREWHTELTAVTDANGIVKFRGFYGEYAVTLSPEKKSPATFSAAAPSAEVLF